MADNTKYYYMRLKENFFDSENMVLLESMPDGYLYSNILLKLYLRSLKGNGRLMLNDRIPYNPQMIATLTRHQIGTVEKALGIFSELGLIEVLDNGAIYMLDIQNFIGKSSTEADRQRAYQAKIASERIPTLTDKESCKKSNKKSNLKIEKEIELEIETEIETKKRKPASRFTPPTVEEVRAYCQERQNNVDPEKFVDYYTSNGWVVGKSKMKDWKAAVRSWERNNFSSGTYKQKPVDQKPQTETDIAFARMFDE